jgi:hypothetical protein
LEKKSSSIAGSSRPKPVGPAVVAKAAVPKLELEGKKWMIEHFNGNKNIQVGVGIYIEIFIL